MNNNNFFDQVSNSSATGAAFKSYLLKIYGYMTGGLLLTALTSYLVAGSPYLLNMVFNTPLRYLCMFAPFIFILVISFGINKLSAGTAQLLFWLFSGVMGISLSSVFIVYTAISVTKVFLITSATFLTMSIYGYTTKRDLSKFGAILLMALIGIIIASIVNMFTHSSKLDFIISIIGILVFTGLTAWDTQKIKLMYDVSDDDNMRTKKSVMGALSLYLDFINLFLMLLRIMGDRR